MDKHGARQQKLVKDYQGRLNEVSTLRHMIIEIPRIVPLMMFQQFRATVVGLWGCGLWGCQRVQA